MHRTETPQNQSQSQSKAEPKRSEKFFKAKSKDFSRAKPKSKAQQTHRGQQSRAKAQQNRAGGTGQSRAKAESFRAKSLKAKHLIKTIYLLSENFFIRKGIGVIGGRGKTPHLETTLTPTLKKSVVFIEPHT